MFSCPFKSYRTWRILLLSATLVSTTTCTAYERDDVVVHVLETHAANKQRLLQEIQGMSPFAVNRYFGMDFRELWRRILIDGSYEGRPKEDLLHSTLRSWSGDSSVRQLADALNRTHRNLFGFGKGTGLMVRYAGDPAFKPFGRHMVLAEALGQISRLNDAQVQAFQTIFETGRNTRGYVHKLECHGRAIEYIYAVTDIVYGVMLPSDLDFDPNRVVAYPEKVQMFYVKAGEVIALRPYVLHSGALSVEPNRDFSVIIYKEPLPTYQSRMSLDSIVEEWLQRAPAQLPEQWEQKQTWLKIAGTDKYYLTLAELHTGDLADNRGFVVDTRPLRLPNWK